MVNLMMATPMAYGVDKEMRERIKANTIFSNVLNRSQRAMFLKKLVGKQNNLQALSTIVKNLKSTPKQSEKVVTVPLEKIVGSESRIRDFDKHFRPLVSNVRERWVRIASAYHLHTSLPPVALIQVGDEYYVRDGHHRISVAKTFGQATIEAQIIYELA